MAKITSLHLDGYKGQNVVENLSGLDMFVGPNGAGKSSRPEGLSLAMLGYIPGRQKRPEETMKVSAGDEMSVGLTLDTGFGFMRTFTRNETYSRSTGETKISIKESLSVTPSKGESTETARKNRVAQELGNFSIHLDFAEFEAMSPAKKREYLYQFVEDTDDWTKEDVANWITSAVLTQELETNNPDAYAIAEKITADALAIWAEGLTVEEGVLAMLEWAKEQQSVWNAKKKDAAGAVRQLADLKNQMEATDRDIAANKEALESLRSELIEVEKELSRGQEVKKTFENRKARISEREAKIADLKKELGPVDTAHLDTQIGNLRKLIVDVNLDTTNLDSQIDDASSRRKIAEQTLSQTRQSKAREETRLDTLTRSAEMATEAGGLCVISKMVACPKDFTPFLSHIEEQRKSTQGVIQTLTEQEEEQAKEVEFIENEIRNLNGDKKSLLTSAQQTQANNADINRKINNLEREKMDLDNRAKQRADQLNVQKTELEHLLKESVTPVPDLEVLELQSKGLQGQITEMAGKISAQETQRATLMNMQASMLDNKDAEYRWSACASISEALGPKGVQGELLKGGLEPLRETIQGNFNLLGIPHPFQFRTENDRGREIFDFGWVKSGVFVGFDSLSTGERLMVLLAVLAALLQGGDAKVRALIIDEFQSLDEENFKATLEGLKKLYHAEQLDNVLIAGVLPITELDGWNVRVLGAEAEAEAS